MKIAFFELRPWEERYFKENLRRHTLVFNNNALQKKNVKTFCDIECLATFAYSDCTAEVLKKLPKLKYITTMSTGFDNIDVEYCKKNKIKVMNVPAYGENTVAEFTFALILALTRKIYFAIKRVREENFFSCHGFTGTDLQGKTIGIIGTGKIGSHMARIAYGFEMKIFATSHHNDKALIKKYGVKYVPLTTLLRKVDIVTLHIPYTKESHHILNKQSMAVMKKGAYIINTARGALIDTHALCKALNSKHIAGAALDVLEQECEIKDERQLLSKNHPEVCNLQTVLENHQLMKMSNVIVTPHNAWNSQEALEKILKTTVENILSVSKKRLKNVVC